MNTRQFLKAVTTSVIGATVIPKDKLNLGIIGVEDNLYIEIISTDNILIQSCGVDGRLQLFPNTFGEVMQLLAQVTKEVKGGINQRVRFESEQFLKTEFTEQMAINFRKNVEIEVSNNPDIFKPLFQQSNKKQISTS